jgi:hypothetical protein
VENSLQILNKTKKSTLACFVECEQSVMHFQNNLECLSLLNCLGQLDICVQD